MFKTVWVNVVDLPSLKFVTSTVPRIFSLFSSCQYFAINLAFSTFSHFVSAASLVPRPYSIAFVAYILAYSIFFIYQLILYS